MRSYGKSERRICGILLEKLEQNLGAAYLRLSEMKC